MISHRNVIANTMQISAFEKTWRDSQSSPSGNFTEAALGLLPQSHIYSLVVICHAGPYRGDQVIVLPKFELKSYLAAIQDFKIGNLFLVSMTEPGVRTWDTDYFPGSSNYHHHAPESGNLFQV